MQEVNVTWKHFEGNLCKYENNVGCRQICMKNTVVLCSYFVTKENASLNINASSIPYQQRVNFAKSI